MTLFFQFSDMLSGDRKFHVASLAFKAVSNLERFAGMVTA